MRLDAQNHFLPQFGNQVRVFAITFQRAPPTRVTHHIKDRGIDIGIAQGSGFLSGNFPCPVHQITIPSAANGNGSRERRCFRMVQPVDTFITEIHRNPQTSLFHKPTLHGINCFRMVAKRVKQVRHSGRFSPHSVQHLVDIADAVFPDFLFPSLHRQ